jgi:hypothetical protein
MPNTRSRTHKKCRATHRARLFLAAAVLAASLGSSLGVAAPGAEAASCQSNVCNTGEMTATSPQRARAVPLATIPGDCGKVTFVNYGKGHFRVIVDSHQGGVWYVQWHVAYQWGVASDTAYNPDVGNPHFEFPGKAGSGGPMVLVGTAMTSGGECEIAPNPA